MMMIRVRMLMNIRRQATMMIMIGLMVIMVLEGYMTKRPTQFTNMQQQSMITSESNIMVMMMVMISMMMNMMMMMMMMMMILIMMMVMLMMMMSITQQSDLFVRCLNTHGEGNHIDSDKT